ncbi:universal stress protein [Streptomyces sp. NPDC097981]|uniref:universal stress protein n=1 Tax=Streptomyces sp. NPDC097981 TaxID=3155428 RepID=UPI00332C29AB
MSSTVVAGLDGSAAATDAVEWAAQEAASRALPLRLLHVWNSAVAPFGHTPAAVAKRLDAVAEGLRAAHPGLEVTAEGVPGHPAAELCAASGGADLLVLGFGGANRLTRRPAASVVRAVLARAEGPLVLVSGAGAGRAGTGDARASKPCPAQSEVVLGLDASRPCDEVIRYAFEAAAAHGAALRVVHGGNPPESAAAEANGADEVLRLWRERFPTVPVRTECVVGRPVDHLVDASADASMVVVGRRIRRAGRPGNSVRTASVGPVTRGVLHRAARVTVVVSHR